MHQGCVAVCLVVLSVRPTTSHASLNKSTIYSHPDINIGIFLVLEGNCCRLNTFMAVLRLAPFLYSICWQLCCDTAICVGEMMQAYLTNGLSLRCKGEFSSGHSLDDCILMDTLILKSLLTKVLQHAISFRKIQVSVQHQY